MNDPDGFFASQRIALVGLGLMGGSLALALRGRCAELFGVDPDPAARKLALEQQVVDHIYPDIDTFTEPVDAMVLAAPVGVIIDQIHRLGSPARARPAPDGRGQPGSTILLDLGSTKREIVAAMQDLPEQYDPIGGHPMCGKETSGLANADAEIYRGATFAFTPLERTSSKACEFAENLAAVVGAVPIWINPETHDRWVAATSHLPYLLAGALAGATPPESAPMAGPGFRSTSRLAESSLTMMLDILKTNRQPVLEALHRFKDRLELLEESLSNEDFSTLCSLLDSAAKSRQALMRASEKIQL